MINTITINKDKIVNNIKPMHCTNNLPYFPAKQAGEILEAFCDVVPFVRFHDTFLLSYQRFIDVNVIFPNFDADENDENSYDFTFTDYLLKFVTDKGIKPFYRLGVSIENQHWIKTFNIYPPKDFHKWARICEHIIMHYNEGWANGFNMGIEYWEIWNEPDNSPELCYNQMWKASFDEFLLLYEIASKHLKQRFPYIKIGGYASSGVYAVLNEHAPDSANVDDIVFDYFLECFLKFIKYVSSPEHKSPLDFFSWHSYHGVDKNPKYVEFVRKTLDQHGFTNTENILNEWNPNINLRGTLQDASNVISDMIELQKSSLDMLMYYDARKSSCYGGLFSPVGDAPNARSGKILPTYYSFKMFNELYKLGKEIQTNVAGENVYSLSSTDGDIVATVIANNSNEQKRVELIGFGEIIQAITNSDNQTYVNVQIEKTLVLKPFETLLIYSK